MVQKRTAKKMRIGRNVSEKTNVRLKLKRNTVRHDLSTTGCCIKTQNENGASKLSSHNY